MHPDEYLRMGQEQFKRKANKNNIQEINLDESVLFHEKKQEMAKKAAAAQEEASLSTTDSSPSNEKELIKEVPTNKAESK